MINAKVELTQPLKQQRQFVAQTGSEHELILDDSAGGTGPKPIELVAVGLAGRIDQDVLRDADSLVELDLVHLVHLADPGIDRRNHLDDE